MKKKCSDENGFVIVMEHSVAIFEPGAKGLILNGSFARLGRK